MSDEEVGALKILNDSIDIVLSALRKEVKNQMDAQGNVNGFALLYALNTYGEELKIRGKKKINERRKTD